MKREMRNFKVLLPFMAIVCLWVGCADEYEKPEEEFEAAANLIMQIKLSTHGNKTVDKINEEIISDLSYDMEDVANLFYVVHSEDGKCLSFYNLHQQHIRDITVGGVTTWQDRRPFGKYLVTLIVSTENKFPDVESMTKKYSDAVCQIPNNHVFYKTMEVDCTFPEGINSEDLEEDIVFGKEVELHLLTGEFNFLLPAGDKGIPEGANFSMTVEANNLPSAFFLKNGKTLNSEEVTTFSVSNYNHTFKITSPFENQLVAKYILLDNQELEDTPEERGSFQFTYKEDVDGDVTYYTDMIFPECKIDPTIPLSKYSYNLITDLYHSVEGK